jgi:hypothetical protein
VKRKTLFWIIGAVVAAHAVAFYLVAGMSPLPKVPYTPPDNFSLGWAKFTDPTNHQKMVYQEFTVSSRVDEAAPSPGPPKP